MAGDPFGDIGSMGPAIVRDVARTLYAAGDVIRVEAQLSITRGAVSGKKHVASKPGEPPKNDSAVLANNMETVQVEPLKVEVSSNAPYAAALERGTSKMAARPYMVPAVQKTKREVNGMIAAAVKRAIRTHFRR